MSEPSQVPQDAGNYSLTNSLARLKVGGSEGEKEDHFDSRFAVAEKPSRFFNVGRVFKTLWIEPAGSTAKDTDQKPYHTVGYGQLSYAKVRRFVVIRKRLHSCLCLMISTYGGQGAAKEDTRSRDHAVVYSSQDQEPLPLPEENMTLEAFPVIIEEAGEDLGVMSRLDFGKVYTVEHNVKVLRFGRIAQDQIKRLNETFATIMGFPTPPDDSDLDAPDSQAEEAVPAANSTPSTNPGVSRFIKGTAGHSEKLDTSYKVRNKDYKKFFRIGRVFSTLWSATRGVNADSTDPDGIRESVEMVMFGEKVYAQVRHFVVVREGDRSCTCLPVTSYDGAGHRKPGIVLAEHGFMYCEKKPKKVDGMRSRALKVNRSKGSVLREPSLVNYGKVYTIETNVKVKDAGEVDQDSRDVLLHYFRKVFVAMDEDPPEQGLTPRASTATLAHIGTGLETYNYPPLTDSNPSTDSTLSDISSISVPQGYPTSPYVLSNEHSEGYRTALADYRTTVGDGYNSVSPYSSQPLNAPYTVGYGVSPRYYSSSYLDTPYSQPSAVAGFSSHSGYRAADPSSSMLQTADYYGLNKETTADDDLRLPTLEEEQSPIRRESKAGANRERDRRKRR